MLETVDKQQRVKAIKSPFMRESLTVCAILAQLKSVAMDGDGRGIAATCRQLIWEPGDRYKIFYDFKYCCNSSRVIYIMLITYCA